MRATRQKRTTADAYSRQPSLFVIWSSRCDLRPQNRPDRMQQFLKAAVRAARARIISPELFEQLFFAVDDAIAAFDVRFRWIAASSFARALKSGAGRSCRRGGLDAWGTSLIGSKVICLSRTRCSDEWDASKDRNRGAGH